MQVVVILNLNTHVIYVLVGCITFMYSRISQKQEKIFNLINTLLFLSFNDSTFQKNLNVFIDEGQLLRTLN